MTSVSTNQWNKILVLCLAAPFAFPQSANRDSLQRYFQEGQKSLAEGRYDAAEAAYEKLRQLTPETAEVHANLGLIYFQERKFEQAVPALRQALKLKPTLAKTGTLLAISLSELGHYKDAIPGLEKAFYQPSDPATKRMCGLQLLRAYTGQHSDDKAVAVALELNRTYADDPEVLYHTGKIFGNFAFLSVQRLVQIAPNSVWKHQAAAEAYESQGSYDLAADEYRAVLVLDPMRAGTHYRLGRTLLARSLQRTSAADRTEAEKEFQKELQVDPSNANAAYELGETRRKSGQLEEARGFFELALKYYPDFEEANLGLAAVLLQQQKSEQALVRVQKAITTNPHNEVSWYRLSLIQRALGNVVEQQRAMAEFRRLRSQNANEQEGAKQVFSPKEVTKQQLDTEVNR